jgi:3-phosphoshikimate 1-carboxyvinyltransferase
MNAISYPEELEILPLRRPPRATVRVPGSKSITNRALVLAALTATERGCTLGGALRSEDTEVMIDCLRALGFTVEPAWAEARITVRRAGDGPCIRASAADLFVANSGTTMRFLTALVSLGHGRYRLDGVPRMRERPIEDLLVALRQLGVNAYSEHGNGCPPVVVESAGLGGGTVRVRGDVSSQFLSGLLMTAPFARGPIRIEVEGSLVSRPYVEMTMKILEQYGLRAAAAWDDPAPWFAFGGGSHGRGPGRYDIEPDASAASYFLGAAAVTGGEVTIPGLGSASVQGDVRFLQLLTHMGCQATLGEDSLFLRGGPLRGADVDMNDISDTVMTLAAVACFGEGPTTIRNVAHIRHKETDRLAALATELRRVGAAVDEFADGLTITPGPLHGAHVETYNDHRMAMSMALIGLRVPDVVIRHPACVAKTYPGFFDDLDRLRG